MILLLKFLIRLLFLLKISTPQNVFTLISYDIELLQGLGAVSHADLQFLELSTSIAEILNATRNQPWTAAWELQKLSHNGSMRSNAAIGLALRSLPSGWMTSHNQPH